MTMQCVVRYPHYCNKNKRRVEKGEKVNISRQEFLKRANVFRLDPETGNSVPLVSKVDEQSYETAVTQPPENTALEGPSEVKLDTTKLDKLYKDELISVAQEIGVDTEGKTKAEILEDLKNQNS